MKAAIGRETGTSNFAPGIESAFPEYFGEHDCVVHVVEGEIPDFVRGAYYANGPARFGLGDVVYRNWLDGDGTICSLAVGKDDIRLRNRYIRSTKFTTEKQAGKSIFRTFGTSFENSRLNRLGNALESPVNVSVYPFADRLLAFGEQGLPWELDLITLETLGQFTFDERLNEASPFAAHPKVDSQTGEMFNFGIFFSPQTPRLYIYCFNQNGLRYRKAIPLEHPYSVHDFALSKDHLVFYLSPYLLDVSGVLQGGQTIMESLQWQPQLGSRLLILKRSNAEVVASIPVNGRYCLHLINAFEHNNRLCVDLLEFDGPIYGEYQPVPDFFNDVSNGGPVRFAVDLTTREIVEHVAIQYLQAPDFPAIDPRHVMHSCEEFWMLGISATGRTGRKFFDQLVHASWKSGSTLDVYTSPAMRYLSGEPVFVGAPESKDGVVICQEFDAREQKSFFLFFDSQNVSSGPIARIATDRQLPLAFHAIFQASR